MQCESDLFELTFASSNFILKFLGNVSLQAFCHAFLNQLVHLFGDLSFHYQKNSVYTSDKNKNNTYLLSLFWPRSGSVEVRQEYLINRPPRQWQTQIETNRQHIPWTTAIASWCFCSWSFIIWRSLHKLLLVRLCQWISKNIQARTLWFLVSFLRGQPMKPFASFGHVTHQIHPIKQFWI